MGVVKITSVHMLMGMLILISLYMKTCSIALLLVIPNLVTNFQILGALKGPICVSSENGCHARNQTCSQVPLFHW